ncbi:hypothetical protein DPMN_179279 [Dreissena polymorpha]|uniref:Uncharacterized protein n=2 Tax=Dreissena polymorpha TaxID=45954 RepID=A0A9D4IJF5_DREPO|nr:hypothetical protein DPMN_179279 [Dreissena polymorpha]
MGSQCVTVLAIIVLLIALASAVMSTIALVLIAILKKTHDAADQKKRAAIGRWNQVIDSTLAWKRPKV